MIDDATIAVTRPLRVFVVAGEHSGDALGGKLMAALKQRAGAASIVFEGVGGEDMAGEGLRSLFPLSEVAVMGPAAIARRLPSLIRRVHETVAAAKSMQPHVVVIIDSPEFTHPIAKRIRRAMPEVPIVNYVSPSVWAWRPGRAKRMRGYVDHVLALLPFEPDVHERLGGPPCSYVGHPLIERWEWIRSRDREGLAQRLGLTGDRPVLVVLPGSRASEVQRLAEPFGAAIGLLAEKHGPVDVIVPTVASVRPLVESLVAKWPVPAHLVAGDEDKFAAFRLADAALAASGTVTLELAVAGTPMIVAYKVEPLATLLRFLVKAPSIVLANLVLGENVFPEFIQEDCTPEKLSEALAELIEPSSALRAAQVSALQRIEAKMRLEGDSPSMRTAKIVIDQARRVEVSA